METFLPGRVYENLIKMTRYRNIKLSEEPLSTDTVVTRLNHYEFLLISGKRTNDMRGDATVHIVLIAPGSIYATKSPGFKKLLKALPKNIKGEKTEVIFISEEALTVHIKKVILSHKKTNPGLLIESHNYAIFEIETPKHESVPPHFVATDEEVNEFCTTRYTSREYFPKILQSDPQAVWLGLRPGMVVRVERLSETAGISIAYRYCIR